MYLPKQFLAALTLAFGLTAGFAHAQETSAAPAPLPTGEQHASAKSPAAAAVPAASGPADGVAGPDIYLLPDETGKLRRVLGYRYEDFLRAWQSADVDMAGASPPRFAVDNFTIDAAASDQSAKLKATVTVELHSTAWVEVPLQLGSLIVETAAISDGSDQEFVRFDSDSAAYSAWLKGKPGEKRTVVLTGKLPIQQQGDLRRLNVDLPMAASSLVKFTAHEAPVVESPEGVLITSTVDDRDSADGATGSTVRIEGAKGRLSLRWGESPVDPVGASDGDSLEATVETIVTVEPNRLSYDAVINLSGSIEPIEKVRLRLPAGTIATAPSDANYEIVPITKAGSADLQPTVELQLSSPSVHPPPLRVLVEQDGAGPPRGPVFHVQGIEVLGALIQRGHAAVRVSEQLHAHFQSHGRVERIEPPELPEKMQAISPLAAFSTAGSSWLIDVYTQPRQRKVRVTPTYGLRMSAQDALLEVVLDYQITGGRTFDLRVDLGDWQLTEMPVEAGGAVDVGEQHVTEDGILILPLKDSATEQVRVRFGLRRTAGLGSHVFAFPVVEDASLLPGALTVIDDPGQQSVVRVENSIGVAPNDDGAVAADEALQSPRAQNGRPMPHRFQVYLPRATVAVDVQEQEQIVAVESVISASLSGDRVDVEQQLRFDIAHQPADEISAIVPADLLANEGFVALLDGKPLASTTIEVLPLAAAKPGAEAGSMQLLVKLPRPAVGRATLGIRCTIRVTERQLSGAEPVSVPLATVAHDAQSHLTVHSNNRNMAIALEPRSTAAGWVAIDPPSVGGDELRPEEFTAIGNKPLDHVHLSLKQVVAAAPEQVRLTSSWAQTWLSGNVRQDRFVYRFETRAEQVNLLLPAEFNSQPLEVLLDGQPSIVDLSQAGRLSVRLPASDDLASHTVELRRQSVQGVGSWERIGVTIPRLEGSADGRPFFWQLIVPRELTALGSPGSMSPEYLLGWQGMYWGRQPTQTQGDLERWTGAHKAPSPAASTNQYLYSGFEPPAELQVLVVRRIWIVIAAGLVALGVGLAWLHTRAGRSVKFWMAVCVAAVALLLSYPEAAVLMIQAAAVGGLFTALSAVTQWLLADVQTAGPASPATASSSIASLAATQSWVADGAGGSAARTQAPSYQSSGSGP